MHANYYGWVRCAMSRGTTLQTLFPIDERLATPPVFDHRGISRDELFADTEIRAERALGDDHAPILALDIKVALIAEEIHHLAQDGYFHRMIGSQI